jgi:hypothetical protein
MSRFVVATETYFYNTVLAPAAKSLEDVCNSVDTIDACNKKHEDLLKALMKRALVTSNLSAVRTPLLQALVEICSFSFGPLMSGKPVSAQAFVDSAETLSSIVHELRSALPDNETLRFLDELFIPFLATSDG